MNLYLRSISSCLFRNLFEIQRHLSHGMSLESRAFSSGCSSIHVRACAQYHDYDYDHDHDHDGRDGHVHDGRDEHGYDHALDDAHDHGYIFLFIF